MKQILIAILFITTVAFAPSNPDRTRQLVESGETALANYEFVEAINLFTEAIDENPNNPSLYLLRAKAYLLSGQFIKYVEEYQKAYELDPQYVERVMRLGKPNDMDENASEEIVEEVVDPEK